ncbi:hypothetical protein AB0J20_16375 [Micromonospora costi]|uniref:hypothetical protein n=1 Tax=Micromonospora costi TaxID=1530042 RepID=UPI0033D67B0E
MTDLAPLPAEGDPHARYGAVRAQALRDAHAKAIELLNAYPVPTFCAAAIESRLDDWMRDQIEACRD